jgi:hypothetical protein
MTKRDVRNNVRKMIQEAKETKKNELLKEALELLKDQTSNQKAVELMVKINLLLGNKVEETFVKPATIMIEIKKVGRPDLTWYQEDLIGQQFEVYAEKMSFTTARQYICYVEGKELNEVQQGSRITFRNDDIKIVK